jgi:hypothetical protein
MHFAEDNDVVQAPEIPTARRSSERLEPSLQLSRDIKPLG